MADGDILSMADRAWQRGDKDFDLVSAAKVKPEPVRWLWPDWLSLGKLHLLAGSPGTGKTTIAVSLAAAITTGAAWPDGGTCEPGDVLIWSGEDGIADTLLPRFLAAGGDRERLHFAGAVSDSGRSRPFNPATDLSRLIAAARTMPNLRLIVLDPVVAVIVGDSHKNSETRRDLQPVVGMAEELDVAVLGITHLSKGTTGREPLERVMGSIAFAAVARVVLATVKARDPQQPHRLVRAKSNLGPDRGGLEYNLLSAPVPGHDFHAQRVDWGQPLDGSAHELMAIEGEEDDALASAREFLAVLLAKGPLAVRELKPAALAHGHKWRTVERAKPDLGIKAIKGVGGAWFWTLPVEADPAVDQQHRRQDGCGGVGGDGGEGPLFEAKAATTPQDRHTEFGGGVVDADLQRQIADLEDSIAAKREQVKTLASLQHRTGESESELRQMEQRLEALKTDNSRRV
jgi:putative DNA primase/helicase